MGSNKDPFSSGKLVFLVPDFSVPHSLFLPSHFSDFVALLTLLARRLILLNWKSPHPLFYTRWVKDFLYFMKLEKIRVLSSPT